MDFLDEESDDEYESYKLFGGKEGIVFLIDSTEPMFDCQQFSLAIQCVENVMKNKAISSPSDEVAIVLFGTDKTSNDDSFERIFIVQKLQKTSADLILGLKRLTEPDFRSDVGHSDRFSLADVFSTALSEFSNSRSNFQTKRVILFTCNPEPHSGSSAQAIHLRNLAITRAKDFKDHSIDVEFIPLNSNDRQKFDFEAFYQFVFPDLKDDDNDCQTLSKLEPLLKRIHSKSYRQRMLGSIPFRLGPWGQQSNESTDVKLSVYVYNLYSEAKKPTVVMLNRKDLKEVKRETQRWTQDCGALVSPEELKKKFEFGREKIFLNKSDMKSIIAFEEPALTLVGFKPRTAMKSWLHIKPGQFIFPNESATKGGTTLFNALLKRCAERDKVAICRFTARRSAQPRLVALYPQIESKPLDKPGGFHVAHLPFKDDIRELDIKNAECVPVNAEALQMATNIVEKLSFKYNPQDFPNPILQTHYRTVEALALNYTDPEPFDDSQTQPDYESIETKAGYDLYSLNQLLGGYAVQPLEKPRVKVYDDLSDWAKAKQLGSLTVPELKQFCNQKNIEINAKNPKKADFVEAVRQYYKL